MFNKTIKQFLILGLAAIFIFLAVSVFAQEQKPVEIITFHQQGCSYCALQDKFFNENLEKNYNVKINKYYLSESANIELLKALSSIYNHPIEGTPTLFVGDEVFSGHDGNIELAIIAEVNRCLVAGCESPLVKLAGYVPDGTVTVDEKFKKTGYIVMGIIAVLIIIIVAFSIKPKRRNNI